MKKRIAIVCTLLVMVLAVSGAYYVFDKVFPKSESINFTDTESVISVTVSDSNNEETEISNDLYGGIVSAIAKAKPTRKQSVNDCPAANPHYEIKIQTNERLYCFFVYKENNVYYLELPYEGVWRTDSVLYSKISMLF